MTGPELVRSFFETKRGRRPNEGYSLKDIDRYVETNSSFSAVTTRTAIQRLIDKGEVVRLGRGKYLAS